MSPHVKIKDSSLKPLDVVCREECQDYEAGFWNWMEGLGTGVKKDNPTTWQYPAWPPSFRGIINSLEVAHQAFVWRVRRNPRLLKVHTSSIMYSRVGMNFADKADKKFTAFP